MASGRNGLKTHISLFPVTKRGDDFWLAAATLCCKTSQEPFQGAPFPLALQCTTYGYALPGPSQTQSGREPGEQI